MSIELRLLNCSDVVVRDDYPRLLSAQADIAELADSFKEIRGVLLPILVMENEEDHTLILIKGSRRLAGRIKEGEPTIPALVISKTPINDLVKFRAVTHLSKIELSAYETAVLISQIRDAYGLPNNQIAKMIGWGDTNSGRIRVGHHLRLLSLPPDVLEFFIGGNALSLTFSVLLNRLSGNHESMSWAVQKAAKDQMSVREFNKLIDQIEQHEHQTKILEKGNSESEVDSRNPGSFSDEYYSLKSELVNAQYGATMKIKNLKGGRISFSLNIDSEAKLKEILDAIAAE